MTETSVVDSSKEKPEKESSSRMSQSEDAYAPEEPTPDIPISLLDIQMPETPESTKGQVSDGDLPRLESPKLLKPVLGKLQAKKRLMAFANKFNVLPKIQKSNLLQVHSAKFSKSKSRENDSSTGLNTDSDSMQHFHNRHSTSGKSKKKTEEKILAIEEIRREESKSKMLLAEAMAAASLDEESYTNRNGQNLLESVRSSRERSRQGDLSASRKSVSKSSIDNKYSVRRRHGREERRDSASRESKDYSSSKDRYYKGPHDREQRRRDKDKDKKDDKDKRDDSSKYEEGRDRREDEREKKDNEKDKWEDVKEKRGAKEKKETFSEKRSNSKEKSSEARDKREKEKDKDKGKEKDIMNSFSWVDLKKCGIMMDDVIDVRRRDYSDRSTKNRTAEDYVRHFEQMLMLNDCRLKRYAFVAEGLDGPKEYPPESVRITKRGRPQLQYCENPRISLFLNHQQVLQAVATDHREKMREICEVNFTRDNAEEAEKPQLVRNWYPKTGVHEPGETAKWPLPVNVQLPRSKWDSEDEERLSNDVAKGQESEEKPDNATAQPEQEVVSSRSSTAGEDIGDDKKTVNEDKESPSVKETDNDNRQSTSPSLPSAGNEKLASEYEQFMKMVCTDIPAEDFSPKVIPAKSASPSSYHEFNIETNLPEDNNFAFVEHSMSGKSDKADTSQTEDRYKDNESRQNVDEVSKVSDDEASSSSSQIQVQERIRDDKDKNESEDSRSIPSDWENVRIKVERLSDENSDTREARKKKRRKKVTSSSESSSSSSSSDSEEDAKRKRRKRKLSNDDSSVSDSDSSESSSSSSDSSSSDDKRKKKRKKKRKAEKRKKKAKRLARTKKKRRRKMSSDSSSSDSSDEKRKKKAVSRKKSKQKRKYSEKSQDDNEDIIKVIQKSSLEASSPENEKLIRSQVPIKKIKEERKAESRKRSTEKHDIWSKEQELVRKSQKNEEKRDKGEERYLEEWEMDTVILPQQKGERMSKNNIEKMGNTEVESIRKMEKKDERNKKDERSRKDEHFKEKRTGVGKEIVQGSAKAEEESDAKKKKKRDKEKKSSNEFLADWEKESERMSQQMMQDEIRLSKKLDKQKKEKWGETEFDTLNVPSLTQLEREVSKRQLLADDWEVDSLEAVPDLMVNRKKSSRTSKKLEKEVRYDKKTDTYISIEKESSRECKKRQDRLSAMRIWEEEQEEGEREAMMLLEQKNKRKRDEWDIEEESFLREKDERKEKIEDSLPTIDNIHKEVNTPNKDMDIALKHDAISAKKSKKSRWDMASQSEEKLELKAPVMWEEECTEWTKLNTFDRKIDEVTLGRCETTLPKSKIKDEDVEQQPTKSTTSSDIIDLFPRKSQDVDLLDPSWTAEELGRSKSRIKSLENTSQTVDVFFEKSKEHTPAPSTKEQEPAKQLEDIFEINATLTDKNIELYSPSSPALSQKSEDIETFNDSNLNTFNLREDLSQDELKKETSTKSDEESISVSNIPLQIKYREGKYAKSAVTKEQLEDILSMQAEDQSEKKFDVKAPETSLDDLATNEPCLDASNYKQLRMDIFAEYESDESRGKPNINVSEVTSTTSVKDESPEGKAALKLIPKQLLIRRNNERVKAKLISDDPMQHAAALLTIQKKLRESHAVRNDIKSASCEEPANEFEFERKKTTDGTAVVDTVSTEQTTVTDVKVDSKDLSITVKTSITTKSESPSSIKVDFDRVDEYKSGEKRSRSEEIKKPRDKESDTEAQGKSPSREQRRKSPGKKENDRRLGDRGKEKRDKKFDDRERSDRRDSRSSESRRKSSPSSSRGRRRRSVSPRTSWERERSRSKSRSRSWSRSRSKSPKRRDESSSREKRSSRVDEDRCRSRTDDRRERSTRSPRSNTTVYNKDYYKKYGPSKGDRDDWSRRKYDCMERDRDKDGRSYDSMEALRERNVEPDRHREGRFRGDEADRPIWPYESDSALRDGTESIDSYPNSQDLDLDYEEKTYYRDDSIERDIIEGPLRPMPKFKQRRSRSDTRRDRQWENDRESLDLERHGHVRRSEKLPASRGRSPPRSRRTSPRVSHDRYRRGSRSRSRSWSRSRSRTRSRSRSRSRTRSRSRSTSRSRSMRSRSRSRSRSRTRSTSRSRLRSPDHSQRIAERLRSSRSPSVERGRVSESSRERKDEHDNRQLDNCNERGRRIETIVQSVSGLSRNSSMLDSEMHIGDGMEPVATSFQYANENEVGNEYYYTENNLTYPPCIDDSATNSPKRLSLDDRLELELGIKKQQDTMGVSSDYPDNFNSNVCYATSPQQQQMLYHQQATVLQVGNVLQVVPADFNGVPGARREPINSITTPMSSVRGSSQVVRVGNVLQVVPTSLDWSGGQPSTVDQPTGMMYSATVPQPSPVPSVPSTPISIPVPVPVPLPVPGVPPVITPTTPIATLSPVPIPLSVPVPVPGPGPISLPVSQATFPRPEATPQKVPVQPVYNYEAILETRRKEREERKRLRELRRKEKERRRIERINRRALRLLEKSNRQTDNSNQSKSSPLDPSVLKALREGEEQTDADEQQPVATLEKEDEPPVAGPSTSTEEEDAVADEDEEEEEEEEAEVEDDEEDEEEPEDDEEEEEEDDDKSRVINRRIETDDVAIPSTSEVHKVQVETESKEWLDLPPTPLKGILVASGFRTSLPNGNLDDLSTPENDSEDNAEEGAEADRNDANKDEADKLGRSKGQSKTKSKSLKLSRKKRRSKKFVQFADGIKPGEGTSPSGGEGDMPSPPPPTSGITRDGVREIRRSSSRKSRKQEKRTRPPKAKKKVKVKIIKLKKPRVTPLTAMMMDDSDELDDRSPPPPPLGSPPPPHLWPSYLAAYNSSARASEAQTTTPAAATTVQAAPPPPTPLPLLVPPPPLNYTIQPCSKA